jgi:hypothetical protein
LNDIEDKIFDSNDDTNGLTTSSDVDRELKTIVLQKLKLPLGECQGSCGRYTKNRCAPNLKCSRSNQNSLKGRGYDPRIAYCDPINLQKDDYVCYDPVKVDEFKACPVDLHQSTVQPCDPIDDYCMVTPITSDYCCRMLKVQNSTHEVCETYPICLGHAIGTCHDCGDPIHPYVWSYMSTATECHRRSSPHQCD